MKVSALGIGMNYPPPLFCRWQPEVKLDMCDGKPLFVREGLLPSFRETQQISKDPALE